MSQWHDQADRCPTCGQSVAVHTAREGTSSYVGAAEQRVAELEAERDNCLTAITNLKRDRAELEAALREIAGLELVVSSYGAAYVVFEKAKATARDALKGKDA